MKSRAVIPALLAMLVAFCFPQQTPTVPRGLAATLVVTIADSSGVARVANAYLAEDLRVTTDLIAQGKAGVWADDKGVARLGAWRPGKYTLVVQAIGYYQERRFLALTAGGTDTVRIILRPMNMTTR